MIAQNTSETSQAVARALTLLKEGLLDIYGTRLDAVLLYGSRARGDCRDDSDVDVLVVLKDFSDAELELRRMDPLASALSLEFDTVLCMGVVRTEAFSSGEDSFLDRVRKEGIPV